jgi:hypothetical protein
MSRQSKQISDALQDAGVEKFTLDCDPDRGWVYTLPSGTDVVLGKTLKVAMAAIAQMPNPNSTTEPVPVPEQMNSETRPDLYEDITEPKPEPVVGGKIEYDDFGNLVHSRKRF